MLITDPVATAAMICQDVSASDGKEAVLGFAKHSAQSFGNELTHAGYKDIPTSYLLCEKDMAGPPDFQRDMIAMIEEVSGRKVDVTGIQSGHMPNWSAKEATVEWILDVVKKAQARG